MKRTLNTHAEIQQYLHELLHTGRPGDTYARIKHAPGVNEIIENVTGNLISRADPGSIEVGQITNRATGILRDRNMFWFTVRQREYAIVYSDGNIVIRDRNQWGGVVATLNNSNKDTIRTVFAGL